MLTYLVSFVLSTLAIMLLFSFDATKYIVVALIPVYGILFMPIWMLLGWLMGITF